MTIIAPDILGELTDATGTPMQCEGCGRVYLFGSDHICPECHCGAPGLGAENCPIFRGERAAFERGEADRKGRWDARPGMAPCAGCGRLCWPDDLSNGRAECVTCEEAAIPVNATPWVVVCAPGLALSWCQRCDAYLGRPTRVLSARIFLSVLTRFMRQHRHCTEAE